MYSTNRMPRRHHRSSTGRGPGDRLGHFGSSGSITAHNASSTIHGLLPTPRERLNPHTGHGHQHHITRSRYKLQEVTSLG